jgi:3-hydroxybutyryl-CoA dehydratase
MGTWKAHYEDCQLGDRVVTPGRTMTETDIVMFSALSGDWQSIHVDKQFAAKESPFGERIAQGLLCLVVGICLLSRVGWFVLWPQSLVCITKLERVRFLAPVIIGDTLRLEAEIVEKEEMSDEAGLITTRLQIKNQRDESVIKGRITIKAGRRAAA